jgi:hypothetical protein
VLHNFPGRASSAGFKSLISQAMAVSSTSGHGVFDNHWSTARKSLILKRRDVRVVEGARLESEAGEQHQSSSNYANAHPISDLTFQIDYSVCIGKPRCSSALQGSLITVLSQSRDSLRALARNCHSESRRAGNSQVG